MEYVFDVEKLRRDMKEDYLGAMCCGFPMAVVDLTDVECTSHCEVVELAQENGVDLREYIFCEF